MPISPVRHRRRVVIAAAAAALTAATAGLTPATAAEQVLTALVGPRSREPFTITSPSQPGATRTYTAWRPLTDENIDARVWSGIHTRTADVVGAHLGRAVATPTLRHATHLLP